MECKNKIEISGRVGTVKLHELKGVGITDATLTVCVTDVFKGSDGAAIITDTWFVATWWGVPEADAKKLCRGAFVELEGRMRNLHYVGEDGTDRTTMELVAKKGRVLKEAEG